ncbi:hypothetical protein K469DRAFT_640682 [Zopfia rhizophila CBS 207.26]|uniref:Mmc1 C-terminal domain-containing protein n=1 Tax=Zopfia rhizophila CBS 207.26 TaxID=1314779 RepID=A0A6A6DL56_9PEZI|nr:hypothetical protein K469DRAFT_640682 [Zopfia rhizophila CBS 207.26]
MPPWVAYVPRSRSLLRQRGIEWCTCAIRPRRPRFSVPSGSSNLHVRKASTLISPTAINVPTNVLPRNQDLYNALSDLGNTAETYVNMSRLQLALRGLVGQDAVTRVAVLSLTSQRSAQKLARLLLADPLAAEGQWEHQLEALGDEDGRALLLCYGDESEANPPNPLFETLSIPSRLLQSHKLEILISSLNVNVSSINTPATSKASQDAILVPKLQTTSARGVPVPYPVHKTLVLGEGLGSAVEYGRFTSDNTQDMPDIAKVAINLPAPLEEPGTEEQSTYSSVDIKTGKEALESLRKSITNSDIYERGWFRSGIPILSQWLLKGLRQPESHITPAIKSFIISVVDDVEANITKEDVRQLEKAITSNTHQQTFAAILLHLEIWAEKSHAELRDRLDEAFAAPNWHKLAWWKLFWRVDDVGMIASEVLERRWLVDAEKNSIYLAGRMNQAGLLTAMKMPSQIYSQGTDQESTIQNPTLFPHEQKGLEKPESSPFKETGPNTIQAANLWPTQIATNRAELLKEIIPPLQALAQRLVLTTLTTTSLSSALSVLLYVSIPTFSVFEAGAVAALGLVYSLRRTQKLWETARSTWQADVREEGRKALKHTEDSIRLIAKASETPKFEPQDVKQRRAAREAVSRVRAALEKM